MLFYKPNFPLAIIEAKDNNRPVGAGIQQAIEYADALDIKYVYIWVGNSEISGDLQWFISSVIMFWEAILLFLLLRLRCIGFEALWNVFGLGGVWCVWPALVSNGRKILYFRGFAVIIQEASENGKF